MNVFQQWFMAAFNEFIDFFVRHQIELGSEYK